MIQEHNEHLHSAKAVLAGNRRDGFTIPTARLYPFQWNWDSAFVTIGYARYDVEAALTELESLVGGQWTNGMIPHIIFHSENESSYFPNWDFWDAEVNAGAPVSPKTSGITQPPVIAIALLHIYKLHGSDPEIVRRLRGLYQGAYRFQKFWYDHRDPNREGLVSIIHPWESGRDNSPVWDAALDALQFDADSIPTYQRRDVSVTDASERPTDRQYDQFVYLMTLAHRHHYDGPGLFTESGFIMQDCLINALLIRSNLALIELANEFGLETEELREWNSNSIESFNRKLWSERLNVYCSYDLVADRMVEFKEVGGYAAIYSGCCPTGRVESMAAQLEGLNRNGYLLVPSFDPVSSGFDPRRYWRGPVWPQMNWLVYRGLLENGYDSLAHVVRDDLIELIELFGFREYFDPRKEILLTGNSGCGGDHFSWTASTYIDLMYR